MIIQQKYFSSKTFVWKSPPSGYIFSSPAYIFNEMQTNIRSSILLFVYPGGEGNIADQIVPRIRKEEHGIGASKIFYSSSNLISVESIPISGNLSSTVVPRPWRKWKSVSKECHWLAVSPLRQNDQEPIGWFSEDIHYLVQQISFSTSPHLSCCPPTIPIAMKFFKEVRLKIN